MPQSESKLLWTNYRPQAVGHLPLSVACRPLPALESLKVLPDSHAVLPHAYLCRNLCTALDNSVLLKHNYAWLCVTLTILCSCA